MKQFILSDKTAEGLWANACWTFKLQAQQEDSRNGPVLTIRDTSIIELHNPYFRIVNNPDRDANPFFHMMEFIWMMAGRNDLEWIQRFNKNIAQYAEPEVPFAPEVHPRVPAHFHGAYGYRWRRHFELDQILAVIRGIKEDPKGRRHVIQMWDPVVDLGSTKLDVPCNTTIMFRPHKGRLDMTVINRSNDLVWGALGANIVHMTMLHELVAFGTLLALGIYRVVSTNLHVYERHWPLLDKKVQADAWLDNQALYAPDPLIQMGGSDVASFLNDAELFCEGDFNHFKNEWFMDTAVPMAAAYLKREERTKHINNIKCPAWQQGARLWQQRLKKRTTDK